MSRKALLVCDGIIQLAGELLELCLQWGWHFVLVMSVEYTEIFCVLCRVWAWHQVFFIRGCYCSWLSLRSGSARKDERVSRRRHTHTGKCPSPSLSRQSAKESSTPELQKAASFPRYFNEHLRHVQAVGRGGGVDGAPFCSFLSLAPHVTCFQKDE